MIDFQLPFVLGEIGWTNELSELLPYIAKKLGFTIWFPILEHVWPLSMLGHAEQYREMILQCAFRILS